MEGEVKGGQLQFMICEYPVPLDKTEKMITSEFRQFQLTRESLDCFKKDSQVHTTVNNDRNTVIPLSPHCVHHTHIMYVHIVILGTCHTL